MTVVYLDRVVLLNLAVDYLLLLATARLAGLPLRRRRLGLCAALGAAYAAAVFLPGCRGLAHPLCRLAAGGAMCRLAWRRERRPWRLTALFFLLSGALAGLLLAMGLAAGSPEALLSRPFGWKPRAARPRCENPPTGRPRARPAGSACCPR